MQVILHSDHCAKKLLPWFDGMIEADEKYFKEHGHFLLVPVRACATAHVGIKLLGTEQQPRAVRRIESGLQKDS